MKRIISLLLAIMLLITFSFVLTGCDDDDDKCPICGGSGYYQKKDCPGCP